MKAYSLARVTCFCRKKRIGVRVEPPVKVSRRADTGIAFDR